MKILLQDKAFLACATLFLLATGKIIYNKIPKFEAVSEAKSTPEEIKTKETYTPAPDAPPQKSTRSYYGSDLPIKKARPMKNNEWVVGDSRVADTKFLDAVFSNMIQGDSIILESGETVVNLTKMPKDLDVTIKGQSGAVLVIQEGNHRNFKSLAFKDLDIKIDIKNENTLYMGDGESKVSFENTTIDGNDKSIYISEKVQLSFKKSKIFNASFSVNERSKIKFEECELTKEYDTLITLDDVSELVMHNSTIHKFGDYLFYFSSERASVNLNSLKIENGSNFLGGRFNENQITATNLMMNNLKDKYASHSCSSCRFEYER